MKPPRLMDQMRGALRARHYSKRTEQAYCMWVRRFILFSDTRHPAEMGEAEVNAFLTDLAVTQHVSASTQTQALSAIVFLYRHVIGRELGELEGLVRARQPRRLPVVMTKGEVSAVLRELDGQYWLMASLMYGSGLRLMECLRLRVQDVDLERNEITVRDGKGGKDRVTMLPAALREPLREHLARVKAQHEADVAAGRGRPLSPDRPRRLQDRRCYEVLPKWPAAVALLCPNRRHGHHFQPHCTRSVSGLHCGRRSRIGLPS